MDNNFEIPEVVLAMIIRIKKEVFGFSKEKAKKNNSNGGT